MKPTTEHIITALRDGIALRTDLCERLGCENAALTKVIRNMLDRDLITRDLQDGALAYYLTAKGRAWVPGMQSASVRAKAKQADEAKEPPMRPGFRSVSEWLAESCAAHPERADAIARAKERIAAERVQPESPDLVTFRAIPGDSEGGDTDVVVAVVQPVKSDAVSAADDANPSGALHRMKLENDLLELRNELDNARALADKLQHLLTSKEHECESLHAQMAHACTGGCKPDMETVPLADLIQHVALFLDDGQSLTIYNDTVASVQAFGKSFVCIYSEANSVLDASAMLARMEVEA